MTASAKHGNQSAATSPSTTQGDLTQPLTAAPRIKPTLTRCRSARQHNPRPTIHLTTRKFCSKDRGHFITDQVGSRIKVYGSPVRLNATAAQAIGLALHELATNACKYGALSVDAGR